MVNILRDDLSLNKRRILLWTVVVYKLVNLVMSSCDRVSVDCVVNIGNVLRGGRLAAVLKGCYVLLKLLRYLVLREILKITASLRLVKLAKLLPHNISGFGSSWSLIYLMQTLLVA
jgi:hypothetical protein